MREATELMASGRDAEAHATLDGAKYHFNCCQVSYIRKTLDRPTLRRATRRASAHSGHRVRGYGARKNHRSRRSRTALPSCR
jgi:hypothetical protein